MFTVMDSRDQPKLKGKRKKSRFSLRKRLHLTHHESDSDSDREENMSKEPTNIFRLNV